MWGGGSGSCALECNTCRGQKRASDSVKFVLCATGSGCCEANWSPLKGQLVLSTTQPSLQNKGKYFYKLNEHTKMGISDVINS